MASQIRRKWITAIIPPTGFSTLNGICCNYNSPYPENMEGFLPIHKYYRTLRRINIFLSRNFPPMVGCTCDEDGESICSLLIQSKKLYDGLVAIMMSENRRYLRFGIHWCLLKRWNFLFKRIDYVLEITCFSKLLSQD